VQKCALPGLVTDDFPRRPRFWRACRSPPSAMGSHSARRRSAELPVSPGPRWTEPTSFRQLHPLRGVDPPASPFVPNQVALIEQPILSWSFFPSRAFSASTSDPRTRPGARPEHALEPSSPSPRPSGPLSPLGRVTPSLNNESPRVNVVGSPRSPSRSDRTTSRWRSSSHGLDAPSEPDASDLRSLEVLSQQHFLRRGACSSEVSCLLDALET
jgi:hypothetical protein